MLTRTLAAALMLAAPLAAQAHGPSRQKVAETVEIAASPDKVWARIGDFQDMSWHPSVFASTGAGASAPDATRTLTLGQAGGPTIAEVLTKHEPAKRSYSYRITAVELTTLPVSNYSSTLTVKDGANGGALVEWRGAFYRGYPNNDPPAELSDAAAVAAVTGVYRAGLDALKAEMEKTN